MAQSPWDPGHAWTALLDLLLLTDRATAEENFELAETAARAADHVAGYLKDRTAAQCVKKRQNRLSTRKDQFQRFQLAAARLQNALNDLDAALTAGQYALLYQGDVSRALPLLANVRDRTLAEIAWYEAAAGAEPPLRWRLADRWLSAAAAQQEPLRTRYRIQAKYWYQRGLLARALQDNHLQALLEREFSQTPSIPISRLTLGLVADIYHGANFEKLGERRVDPRISFGWGYDPPGVVVQDDVFSIRWTGWLVPPIPGTYIIETITDDSCRLWIDGKLMIDHWNKELAAWAKYVEINLNEEPHALVMEHNDTGGGAHAHLSWALKGKSAMFVVPPEALFHDQADLP